MRLLGLTPLYAVGGVALFKSLPARAAEERLHWDNAGATYINRPDGSSTVITYRWVRERDFLPYLKHGWMFSPGPYTALGFRREPVLRNLEGHRWAMMEIKTNENPPL